MHGIDLKTQMDIVYHALNDISKGIIDASCCGAFKCKSAEEARDLIEDLAKCNMKTPSEFSRGNSRGKGILELSKMTAMEAKLDAIMHRIDKQEKKTYTAHEIVAVEREILKGSAERAAEEQFYDAEEVKYLGEQRNYHFKPNTNLPTNYHPALRNHEKFSYGGGASKAQGKDKTLHRVIKSYLGSSSSSKEMNKEMNIRVREGPKLLKNRCCSSWGIIRSC